MSVPSGDPVDQTLNDLNTELDEGDIVIDAGNSDFRQTKRRYRELSQEGISLIDAGCSGGPGGVSEGLSIMIGGDRDAFEEVEEVFSTLSQENGYAWFGEPGSGHFVKMVHNSIEYGMMQCLGEGFELLHEGSYDDIDLEKASRVWSNGAVIESRLVKLVNNALARNPELEGVKGEVPDSGMGRWSMEEAIDSDVPYTALSHSLFARYRSRTGEEGSFSDKLISILRHEFGGHSVKQKRDE